MFGLDRGKAGRLLLQLEEDGYLRSQYKFYRVGNEPVLLGMGGFSYVYEMYDEKNPSLHYAAKVVGFGDKPMGAKMAARTTQLQNFLSEQSDNILRILDLWSMRIRIDEEGRLQEALCPDSGDWGEDGVPIQMILMEKLDRILLKDKYANTVLLKEELHSEEEVIQFAKQIGRAVLTAHRNNILHRDIKLENIFWDENLRQYKLGDFGIAKYVEEGSAETIVFTDGYGAPEIERRLTDCYNAAADIYSFGIVLYLLLNDLKFPGSDGYYVNTVQYSPDFIFPAPQKASEDMAKIIRKMCSYHIEDRYQSVEEVLLEIGRLDQREAQSVSVQEDEDLETETYTDPKTSEESEDEKEKPFHKRAQQGLTRRERKQRDQIDEADYGRLSMQKLIVSSILFALLFQSLSPDAAYVSSWQFWILPIVVLLESVLKSVKEFHVEFAVLSIGAIVYSMAVLEVDVPQIALILAVLCLSPSLTAGCAVGTGLWVAMLLSDQLSWPGIFDRWDLGWFIIILIVAVIYGELYLRASYHKITQRSFTIWKGVMDKLWIVCILVGIMLLLLEHFDIMAVPEIVKHLHFVRVGIGMFVVEVLAAYFYEIVWDDKEEAADEYLDK